jgi:hypothetical protein
MYFIQEQYGPSGIRQVDEVKARKGYITFRLVQRMLLPVQTPHERRSYLLMLRSAP